MKKILTLVLTAACVSCAFGALQFEIISTEGGNAWTSWNSAQQITLKVTEGGSMWMSSFVDSWYGTLKTLGEYSADMSAGAYGTTNLNTGEVTYGTGETQIMTYTKDGVSNTVTAYYVGDFNVGDEISLFITHNSGRVGVSNDPEVVYTDGVNSRLINRVDQAGNRIFNFGFHGSGTPGSVEFILAGGEYHNSKPSGQPLPGVLAALAIGGGVWALRRKVKAA